jgi:FeS assembly protein SufD
MSEKVLNNLNKSPVRTWSWLGVNDISIDGDIPEHKTYNKDIFNMNINYMHKKINSTQNEKKNYGHNEKVDYRHNEKIDVLYNKDSLVYALPLENAQVNYGISDNLLKLAKSEFNTGVFVRGRKGEVSEEPIVINFESDKENDFIVDNNVILAEEGSKFTLLMNYKSADEAKAFHNGLTRIYVAKGAEVTLIKVQLFNESSDSFDSNLAVVEEEAKVNYINIELGSKNALANYAVELKGEKSEGNISSIYLGDKERVIDLNYAIGHFGRKTVSNINVKGALLDKSKKIFRGTLDFKRGAAGAKGSEEEYAVLLSPKVRNRSVPLLLCSEEDVQGAHAASSGKLDEEMLFYIMSRGFSEVEAKKLIIEAAFNPILEKIPFGDIKEEINKFISDRVS